MRKLKFIPRTLVFVLSNIRFGRVLLNFCICSFCGSAWYKLYQLIPGLPSLDNEIEETKKGIRQRINKFVDELPVWEKEIKPQTNFFICKRCLEKSDNYASMKKAMKKSSITKKWREPHLDLLAEILEKEKEN